MSDSELMAVPEVARRIEVFTGTGRRRTWPAEVKARIVAESDRAGETVCGVARRHGLTAQQLFTWRREARRRAAAGEDGLSFAPVILETVPPVPSTTAPSAATSACIEIALAGAVIRVPAGADAATLTMVLRALRSAVA
jgi:transposase